MILGQITIPKLPLKFPPIKTLQVTPSHLDMWIFKASFQEGQNFSSKGGTPWRDTPSRVEQFSLLPYLCGSCETLSHNLKFESVWSFIVPPLFLSHFLSSTHQSTTFPSPSLFFFLSTTHTLHFSSPLLILLLLPTFHHSSLTGRDRVSCQ